MKTRTILWGILGTSGILALGCAYVFFTQNALWAGYGMFFSGFAAIFAFIRLGLAKKFLEENSKEKEISEEKKDE